MRHWVPARQPAAAVLADLVGTLGLPEFRPGLLARVGEVVPAASFSVYRIGPRPALLLSASAGVPDTTRACWLAYLSGPYRQDRSLWPHTASGKLQSAAVCHITAGEVPREHRARVYEAHGVVERVSVVEPAEDGGLLAVNFYRHVHQRPFTDAQLDDFGGVAQAVLALTRKHIALADLGTDALAPAGPGPAGHREQLQRLCAALTARELDVCERLLLGRTQEGVAADLGLSVPTVKTYRNRAFARLGIHFRSQLAGLLLSQPARPG